MIWWIGVGLAVLSTLWLLKPLFLRDKSLQTADRRALNAQAYQEGLAEIERQQQDTGLSPEAAESLRAELSARLVQEAQHEESERLGQGSQRFNTRLGWIGLLVLPAVAALIYGYGDNKQIARQVELGRDNPQLAIEAMVAGLAERLAKQPEDANGWAMLGRSYSTLERYPQAADAYREANARSETPQPNWLVGEAEAWAFANQRNLQGRARALLDQALTLDAEHERALWYAGLSRIQAGQLEEGVAYWRRLLARPDLPETLRAQLQEQIRSLGGEAASQPQSPPQASATALTLQVEVQLAPELGADLPEGGALFVFARMPDGPPMPLAVKRLEGASLPVTVNLSDADAMMPQHRLSNAPRWELVARWSQSGSVQASAGDLEGSRLVERSAAGERQSLLINRRLE